MAERKIDGVLYRVDPITAVEAIELYTDILRFLGPAAPKLPAIIISLQAESEGQQMMADVAALSAISEILSRVPSSEVSGLIARIIGMVKRHSAESGHYDQCDLDGNFTGNLGGIIPVIKFALEETYRDFFTGKNKIGIIALLTEVLQSKKSSG